MKNKTVTVGEIVWVCIDQRGELAFLNGITKRISPPYRLAPAIIIDFFFVSNVALCSLLVDGTRWYNVNVEKIKSQFADYNDAVVFLNKVNDLHN
jgi:hypothetical protein